MSEKMHTLLGLALLMAVAIGFEASACTSFMLQTDQGLYFVHSLEQGNVESVPGYVFINRRDTWKQGYSWESLVRVNEAPAPSLVWKSKYGSVTFNPFGKDLPDGGMNEAGLYIWEMSFDTQYPNDENKPTLFQGQWMQYVLDNFVTVDEVIENAGRMNLDGWGWHYFVADKSGKTAIIDFVGGKPVVHSGDNMPVPLCCNSVYPEAIKWLRQHKGFGGELEIRQVHEEIPRFIYGAELLRTYDGQDPVEYSFHILDEMSTGVRWAIVHDLNNATTYFKTNLNRDVRYFATTPDDFSSGAGPLMLDVEHPGPGNVRAEFAPYNEMENAQLLRGVFGLVCDAEPQFKKALLGDQGVDLDGLVRTVSTKLSQSNQANGYDIEGDWAGIVRYSSTDEPIELPMALVIRVENGHLAVTVNDGEYAKNLPATNTTYKGGLLYFTVEVPESGDILYYQLYMSPGELKGQVEIRGKQPPGTVSLSRRGR